MGDLEVINLICEYLNDPIGIDVKNPRLCWIIKTEKRNIQQKKYRIQISNDLKNLLNEISLFHDTGFIESDQSIQVMYDGPALSSRKRYYWRVKIIDNYDNESSWSEPAYWEMGFLDIVDFNGDWIAIPTEFRKENPKKCSYFRKEFSIEKKIKRARVYATALGVYHLEINGKRITEDILFRPGFTNYDKRVQYQTFDITDCLKKGKNAIGLILAKGWYSGRIGVNLIPEVYGKRNLILLNIVITYDDGSEYNIITDKTWKWSFGPLLKSTLFLGETYDARLEKSGWSQADFNEKWNEVDIVNQNKEILVSQNAPSVRRMEEITPKEILTSPKGETIIDMGQNFAGYVRIIFNGPSGTKVILNHGEVLDKNGNFFVKNLSAFPRDNPYKRQKVTYTLKGKKNETYEPFFTYHGFRYVRIEGYPRQLEIGDVKGIVVYSNLPINSYFECSNEQLNQLHHNSIWSQKSNFIEVPTDCPQREKMGWTGDIQIYAPTAALNMNVGAFLTKWLMDVKSEQKEEGVIPNVIPHVIFKMINDSLQKATAGWGDVIVILPWTLYNYYNDTRILEVLYEPMRNWLKYVRNCTESGSSLRFKLNPKNWFSRSRKQVEKFIWDTGTQWGDWLEPGTGFITSLFFIHKDQITTAYFANSVLIMSKIAKILGKEEDVIIYKKLYEKIKNAYQIRFIKQNGEMKPHKQGSYIVALQFDLMPDNLKPKAIQNLVNLVRENDNHIGTGFLTTPYICNILQEYGHLDVAYDLLLQDSIPSWLYEVKMGATTIWEAWDAIKPGWKLRSLSHNHYAFGAIDKWMFNTIAGINLKDPGFKTIKIQPQPGAGIFYCKAHITTLYGKIKTEWKLDEGGMHLYCEIPSNTNAEIHLPTSSIDAITDNNNKITTSLQKENIQIQNNNVVLRVGSGKYSLNIEY